MKILKGFIIILLFIIFFGCNIEKTFSPTLEYIYFLNHNYFGIDIYNNIIIYNGNSIVINNERLTIGDYIFDIETTDEILSIGNEYTVWYDEQAYRLYLTELPIVSITTYMVEIVDDRKIRGRVQILEKGKEPYISLIGIKLRGGISQSYPKRSYSMELWVNKNGNIKENQSLLGMRVDDDWILDGMWNEPLRIRDFTSHDIWLEMGRVQNANTNTKIGIDREYCELFENGRYRGLYYLGEKIDRKQLDIDKYTNQLEGELYKGYLNSDGTLYNGFNAIHHNNSLTWSGYEAKYPENIGEIDWNNLYEHVSTIVNSSQLSFNNMISSKVDLDNVIDYYIFLNFIYATDNRGKNVYTAKFDKLSLYFFVPWDMDGSFGNHWSGERTDITNKILSNGLYKKLLNFSDFRSGVKERWNELRATTLNIDNIIEMFENNYEYLEKNGIYQREALVSDIAQNYSNTEIDFVSSWIRRRVIFLDIYFNDL